MIRMHVTSCLVHRCLMIVALMFAALIAMPGLAVPAQAQAQLPGGGAFGPAGKPHIRPLLIAETATPRTGDTITLAIQMRPDKGWHGYWENPGDAGAGMRIEWQAPPGVTFGALRYPVPERLVIAGLMNHVYEHDYALLFDVTLPAGLANGTVIPIRGEAQWLACTDSICVPEQGEIAISLTIGDGVVQSADRARFDEFRAQLPRPLDQQAHYRQNGDRLAIAVPYPASAPVGEPWFFALSKQRVRYAEAQTVRRVADMLVIETTVPDGAETSGPIEGVLAVSPDIALRIDAVPGTVPAGGEVIGHAARSEGAGGGATSLSGLLLVLGGAFLGGLILNIMPCVFPILSLKAISLAKAGGDEQRARREALAYTGGILLTCLMLGALMLVIRAGGTQIGWAFQLQDPRVIALLVILVVAITLNLLGLFEIGAISMGQDKAAGGGNGGAFWTGVLAAFVATPCTGPFMGAAMGAALVLPWPLALTVFAGLGLGLASPFVAISWVPALRRMMPRPGGWMTTFRRIMAIPMALTALGLIWLLSRQLGVNGVLLGFTLTVVTGAALAVLGWRQQRGLRMNRAVGGAALLLLGVMAIATPPLVGANRPVAGAGLAGEPFSEVRLAALRQANKPVFLYFTADWCLTCKVNEAGAIDKDAVREAFEKSGITMMVGDWTNADPAISRFLEANGRSGVPLYLYYAPGSSAPRVLPQVLTPATLTALATA